MCAKKIAGQPEVFEIEVDQTRTFRFRLTERGLEIKRVDHSAEKRLGGVGNCSDNLVLSYQDAVAKAEHQLTLL